MPAVSFPAARRVAPIVVLTLALVGASLAVAGPLPYGGNDAPTGCVEPDRWLTLYAEELPTTGEGEVRLGYGLAPGAATIPGPTIEMVEGECLAVTLVNNVSEVTLRQLRDAPDGSRDPAMPLGVSLHAHGVKYLPSSDGTFETGSWVPPGQSRTSFWYAPPRVVDAGVVKSQGTAGYWWYHDHVVGTAHGTKGVGAGLLGALVVRRAQDLRPDHTFVVAMGDKATLNLRRHPATDTCTGSVPQPSATCFSAERGQRVEFVVIGIGNDFHTFHLHGHNWAANRTGILGGMADETPLVDNRTVGPADSFGFQVIAGEHVGAGSWMLHCHVQSHSDAGMSTFLHVREPGLPLPAVPVAAPIYGHGSH